MESASPVNDDRIDRYIAEIPAVVAETFRGVRDQLATWAPIQADYRLLVGAGTSYNALTATIGRFATARAHAAVFPPGAFLRTRLPVGREPLAVVLSQSGASASAVAAIRHAEAVGLPTIAVTALAESPLARHASRLLVLPIGDEDAGPKTKGYAASLMGLIVLADWLDGRNDGDESSLDALRGVRNASGGAARALAAMLDDVDFIAVAGEERHYGTALEAALKISEMSGVPAAGYGLEEMMHGRLQGLTTRSLAILIAADGEQRSASVRAAEVMADHRVRVLIANLTRVPSEHDWQLRTEWPEPPYDVIAAIVPFQQLAVALALRRGMPPHRMPYPGLSAQLGIRLGETA